MEQIKYSNQFFNIKDTLECGQIFRFKPFKQGFLVISKCKIAYCYEEKDFVNIICEKQDKEYFTNFFDLEREYALIFNSARNSNIEILKTAAESGKGIRILKQDALEMLFSFIISQNNNIPRIKGSIEKLCALFGEKKTFLGEEYYTFPNLSSLKTSSIESLKSIGLGYRAEYIYNLIKLLDEGLDINGYANLQTEDLKNQLLTIKGVGPKVADCVLLFGFNRSDTFPVDTWIEKVYKEDFNGKIKRREEQAKWFVSEFKENAGYFQQYLFAYKRLNGKNNNKIDK